MRKGPDGKTIRPKDDDDDGATRKVPRKSIRDRIAGVDDDADAVVTHIAENGAPQAAGSPDDETAIAGQAKAPDPPPVSPQSLSPETTPAHSSKGSAKGGAAAADPNVTQVYRPQRSAASEVELGEDGTVPDPVVGWLARRADLPRLRRRADLAREPCGRHLRRPAPQVLRSAGRRPEPDPCRRRAGHGPGRGEGRRDDHARPDQAAVRSLLRSRLRLAG
jgi:hypothetical protein